MRSVLNYVVRVPTVSFQRYAEIMMEYRSRHIKSKTTSMILSGDYTGRTV